MSISFLQVPAGVKVPGTYVEFDTSKAQQGASIQNHRALLIGQRLAAGTKAAGSIDVITSAAQAREFYGPGSILYHMAKAFIGKNNGVNELRAIALDDDGAAVKAVWTLTWAADPTAIGVTNLYIGDRKYSYANAATDTKTEIIAGLAAAIAADEDAYVTASAAASALTVTARNGGLAANDLDIRFNKFPSEEEHPAGIADGDVTLVATTPGATNPSVTSVITAMGETQYHEVVTSIADTANLLLLTTEMDDRWGPIRANDGHLYYSRNEDFASHSSYLDTRNNAQESVMAARGPTPSWEWASVMAASVAESAQGDPALPFSSIEMTGISAPLDTERFSHSENDLILNGGGSTFYVDEGGVVRIQRMRTTRVQNEFGADDEALAGLNPKLTLSYLRYDFRANWVTKFSRFKIADDGTKFGAGQRIITPKIAKAEAIARFRIWEELGLVEGIDQFKRDLVVQRSSTDVNRMDLLLPPDLVNQLYVSGVQIGFIL